MDYIISLWTLLSSVKSPAVIFCVVALNFQKNQINVILVPVIFCLARSQYNLILDHYLYNDY